jgi:hypothetical protein
MGVWEYGNEELGHLNNLIFLKILKSDLLIRDLKISSSFPYSHTPILPYFLKDRNMPFCAS